MPIKKLWETIKKDPFSVLGMHQENKKYCIRVLHNGANQIEIINLKSGKALPLAKDENGFFYRELDEKFDYELRYKNDHDEWVRKDSYAFSPVISDFDLHLFSEGTHRRIWEILGSHEIEHEGVRGLLFAVWAPNARSVRLVGSFNGWDDNRHYMRPRGLTGVWEIFVPGSFNGATYKYAIENSQGVIVEKSDPYTIYAELRPKTASIAYNPDGYEWEDKEWLDNRTLHIDEPLSIYECHLSSWIRDENNETMSYVDIAEPLANYVLEEGFTHIELMPVTEFPFDGSWGYQVTGYFAPTSRYGTPHDFMYFVDYMHKRGVGVIIDWVPAHFPYDEHGLAKFDGTALYEHADPRLGWHHDWKTHIFNFGRKEVRQFLVGSALYWLDMFHIDGLRVDAVASMLYLDYSRKEGEWIPNKYGGRENLEAIEFLQSLQAEIQRYHPTVMTIAEESTSYAGVTTPTEQGGLGFTYKWNMGWMNDTLSYFGVNPLFRSWHHPEITFSLVYAFSERFILPFSHDEVVHGKGTLLDRMPGGEWEKFANLRLMYAYMWAHPGKKLLFAGQEWGPWLEWKEDSSLDWHLNHYILHAGVRYLVRDLNNLYKNESALHQLDSDPSTFMWIDCDNSESGLLMWVRKDRDDNRVVVILNLNTVVKENYRIGVPVGGAYQEIFNSDSAHYGGANVLNNHYVHSEDIPWQEMGHSMSINVGPLAAVIFKVHPY